MQLIFLVRPAIETILDRMRILMVIPLLVVATQAHLSENAQWSTFKDKHSKHYDIVEDQFRFQIFQRNLRKIEVHNAQYEQGYKSYFLTTTKFADWTEDELNDMFSRQAVDKPKLEPMLGYYKSDPVADYPKSVDWRETNAVTPVKDQGACGSCWAFSTTGSLEGQLAILKNQTVSLSEQELVDCSTYFGTNGCKGADASEALFYVMENGLGSEEDYPYTSIEGECKSNGIPRAAEKIYGFKQVWDDEASLVAAIATIGPISVSADASSWSLYGGGIFDDGTCATINHVILAVGYTEDYLIIKNSWGQSWGEDGYIRIARGKDISCIYDKSVYSLLY